MLGLTPGGKMRRREFLGLLGGAATWPLAAHAQQPAMPVIGYLDFLGPQTGAFSLNLFRRAMSEDGYVDGQNVRIEYRWADGQIDRLAGLAADLVLRRVAVIVTVSNERAAMAAKAATATIPIVFTAGFDPVKSGLVPTLNRPGGNITGVTYLNLQTKRFGLLRQLLPATTTMAFLFNPTGGTELEVGEMQSAAHDVGQPIVIFGAGTATEIDRAFAAMAEQHIGGLIVDGNRFLAGQRDQLVALAALNRIPTCYFNRAFSEAGGLMSYADDRQESWRQATHYIGRILRGAKPADLPVLLPTKFEFVINLKTAKALGLDVPPTLLAIADEVIE
jgi:putative ABC transport system substrate-binding protein